MDAMVVRLKKHFRNLETFDEDHDRKTRELLAAALYESHRDYDHADDTMTDIRENHRDTDA